MPVDVGSVYFQVEMDNSSMLAAIQKMKTDIAGTKGVTTLFSVSLSQASQSGNALVDALKGLGGILGVGVLARFASEAPAVAGAMAGMQVSMMEFKMALGESFAPVFELASNAFGSFVDWLQRNAPIINTIMTELCLYLQTGFDLIKGMIDTLPILLDIIFKKPVEPDIGFGGGGGGARGGGELENILTDTATSIEKHEFMVMFIEFVKKILFGESTKDEVLGS